LGPVGAALIEKISAGAAEFTKPARTIVNAWADVKAGEIKAVGEIKLQAAQRRAIERELGEAMAHQKNLESTGAPGQLTREEGCVARTLQKLCVHVRDFLVCFIIPCVNNDQVVLRRNRRMGAAGCEVPWSLAE
jgi:hypothetical protein